VKTRLFMLVAIGLTVLVIVGFEYRIASIISLFCIALSLFLAVTGVQMIVARRAEIPTSDDPDPKHEHHTGVTAVFWGVLFVMIAVPFGAYGFGYWVYGGEPPGAVFDRLVSSPVGSGALVAVIGVGILLFGLTRLIGGPAAFADTVIGPVQRVASGLGWTAVGSFVVFAGIMHAVTPGTLTRMRDAAISGAIGFAR
jgi:hypothetical protein